MPAPSDMVMLAGEPIPVQSVRDITIPVDGATIGARVYTPEGAGPHPVVMFFHGGGWVICSLDTHDNIARSICRDADALVGLGRLSHGARVPLPHRTVRLLRGDQMGGRQRCVVGWRLQSARRLRRQRRRQPQRGGLADWRAIPVDRP